MSLYFLLRTKTSLSAIGQSSCSTQSESLKTQFEFLKTQINNFSSSEQFIIPICSEIIENQDYNCNENLIEGLHQFLK